MLAFLAGCSIGNAANLAALALIVQKDLDRSVCAKWGFVYDVDVDVPGELASSFDSPFLATWPVSSAPRSPGPFEEDVFGRHGAVLRLRSCGRRLRRGPQRSPAPARFGGALSCHAISLRPAIGDPQLHSSTRPERTPVRMQPPFFQYAVQSEYQTMLQLIRQSWLEYAVEVDQVYRSVCANRCHHHIDC